MYSPLCTTSEEEPGDGHSWTAGTGHSSPFTVIRKELSSVEVYRQLVMSLVNTAMVCLTPCLLSFPAPALQAHLVLRKAWATAY